MYWHIYTEQFDNLINNGYNIIVCTNVTWVIESNSTKEFIALHRNIIHICYIDSVHYLNGVLEN